MTAGGVDMRPPLLRDMQDGESKDKALPLFSWARRRRRVDIALLWAGALVTYVIVRGLDSELNRLFVGAALAFMFGTLSSYMGIASWDDKTRAKLEKE